MGQTTPGSSSDSAHSRRCSASSCELLQTAQRAGTTRPDVGVGEAKTLLVGCQSMHVYNADAAATVTEVALDGLRAKP
ncbi:hypothetical protein [Mycobacterium asiaticum]|uniref:Transcriptional regulator SbtR-like C-terminal domain-containing protein n=1 Tax=Mycobacterium asiaticum TaxID=1790 RepID=A0A1A3NJJ5_MYCAS|nr:hypothetical protein A5635_23135 [Mycobacterium asiaticum]